MTADEIRSIVETIDLDPDRPEEATIREMTRMGHSSSQFVVLREIAAQLAELNNQLQSVTLKKELTEFVEAFRFARLLLGHDEGNKQ